ncbi:MAG: hypothetical protein JWO80_5371 [Bryobacterales bacterium]|nr:hypothetical protein [Bryobacterales bacterium]
MLLIQRNHVIHQLAATTSNPALRESVRDAARFQEPDYFAAEPGITVRYNVPVRTRQRERLSQLLYDSLARRVRRGVEVADLRSSRPAERRPQPPKQPEAGAIPGHYRLGFHNDQGLGQARPLRPERNPEQPSNAVQFGTGLPSLEHGELLPERDCFQSELVARHEEGADVSGHRESERNHQSDLSWMESSGRIILEANA